MNRSIAQLAWLGMPAVDIATLFDVTRDDVIRQLAVTDHGTAPWATSWKRWTSAHRHLIDAETFDAVPDPPERGSLTGTHP